MMNAITNVRATASVSHMITTELGRLHVVDTGAGQDTLVLWPSIFTDHHIYDDLVRRLGESYRFLLIDGPGHGQSEGTTQEFTMEACAAAMAQVMDRLGLDRAVVGGTSWGGLVGAHLALAMPRRVKALLLMNTPMQTSARHPGLKARLIASGARWALGSASFRNGVARNFFSPEVLTENSAYAERFHAMLKTADPSRLAPAIRSVMLRGVPLLPHMPDITVPTLVVAGTDDKMYPIAVQAEAALLAPDGHFAPVGGKHISVVERTPEVVTLISDFIAAEVSR